MLKFRHYAATVALATVMFAASSAQAAEIAVVDMVELSKKSTAIISLNKQVDAIRTKNQAEAQEKDKSLSKEGEEIKKQRSVLAKEAFDKKAQEFEKKIQEVQKDFSERGKSLQDASAKALGQVQAATLEVVKGIATEKKFDVVLQKTTTLYSKDGADITDDVVDKLNKKLGDVKLDVKAKD